MSLQSTHCAAVVNGVVPQRAFFLLGEDDVDLNKYGRYIILVFNYRLS